MTLYYHTEYCLGRRGGRVCHTYRGFQALVVILLSLTLGLAFGLLALAFGVMAFVLRVFKNVFTAAMRLVVKLLAVPFRAARWAARRIEVHRPTAKPAWVPLDELA